MLSIPFLLNRRNKKIREEKEKWLHDLLLEEHNEGLFEEENIVVSVN